MLLQLASQPWQVERNPSPTITRPHPAAKIGCYSCEWAYDATESRGLTMRSTFYFLIVALLVGCATTPVPVDRLVKDLRSSSGLWQNGTFPDINLPRTASTEEVLCKALEGDRQVTNYSIVKVRHVSIHSDFLHLYTEVIVQTNLGEKIVLFKYEGQTHGFWWSRIYDAKTSG
jgi:hypothetical protein